MDKSEKTIIAFVAGAVAGALAGLLLAPEEGEKTRKKLSKKANELADDLEQSWEINARKFKEITDSALIEVEKYSKEIAKSAKNK